MRTEWGGGVENEGESRSLQENRQSMRIARTKTTTNKAGQAVAASTAPKARERGSKCFLIEFRSFLSRQMQTVTKIKLRRDGGGARRWNFFRSLLARLLVRLITFGSSIEPCRRLRISDVWGTLSRCIADSLPGRKSALIQILRCVRDRLFQIL